ncbi:hypothetical protein ACFYNY_02610 [Streptomyces sp. NPDC006530]|uniref:hypothetical protein n=1 Tax=Streptomyces sp. NPDC006530 TaxID=3364750 RepID=UPI0036A1E507
MYLVHARLLGPPGTPMPAAARELVNVKARPRDGLEHVTVHADARPHPVIGLYVRAADLASAEARAFALVRRTLATGVFDGWSLLDAHVPLVGPFYDALATAPATAPALGAFEPDGTGRQV